MIELLDILENAFNLEIHNQFVRLQRSIIVILKNNKKFIIKINKKK